MVGEEENWLMGLTLHGGTSWVSAFMRPVGVARAAPTGRYTVICAVLINLPESRLSRWVWCWLGGASGCRTGNIAIDAFAFLAPSRGRGRIRSKLIALTSPTDTYVRQSKRRGKWRLCRRLGSSSGIGECWEWYN